MAFKTWLEARWDFDRTIFSGGDHPIPPNPELKPPKHPNLGGEHPAGFDDEFIEPEDDVKKEMPSVLPSASRRPDRAARIGQRALEQIPAKSYDSYEPDEFDNSDYDSGYEVPSDVDQINPWQDQEETEDDQPSAFTPASLSAREEPEDTLARPEKQWDDGKAQIKPRSWKDWRKTRYHQA